MRAHELPARLLPSYAGPVLAIDPGYTKSAWCLYDGRGRVPVATGKMPNDDLRCGLWELRHGRSVLFSGKADRLAVEMVASYGMPVGREVFETCLWAGRFIEAWGGPFDLVYRKDVKLHLCGSLKANDATIRQALIDRYGPGKARAVGLKHSPGPLYGMGNDERAALAVAITFAESTPAAPAGEAR